MQPPPQQPNNNNLDDGDEPNEPQPSRQGDEPEAAGGGDADEFERLIPDARKTLMRDTGHVPMLERPTAFNDTLMGFLAETGPAEALEAVPGATHVA